jgi:hypothetical protein
VSGDPWDNPAARAWRKRANETLRPMIESSAASVSLWSDDPDAKLAVEVGFTLLLGKPLIILKPSGSNVPANLARIAEAIIEYDTLDDPSLQEKVHAELDRIIGPSDERIMGEG